MPMYSAGRPLIDAAFAWSNEEAAAALSKISNQNLDAFEWWWACQSAAVKAVHANAPVLAHMRRLGYPMKE